MYKKVHRLRCGCRVVLTGGSATKESRAMSYISKTLACSTLLVESLARMCRARSTHTNKKQQPTHAPIDEPLALGNGNEHCTSISVAEKALG